MFSLPAHQMRQLCQWPSALNDVAKPSPIVVHVKGSVVKRATIHVRCLVNQSSSVLTNTTYFGFWTVIDIVKMLWFG